MGKKKVFERADGLARVVIYVSSGGQFSFFEEAWRQDEDGVGVPYDYWLSVHEGGLYTSLEDAEKDARATIPWLRVDTAS